jgi:hypothetical protein
VTAAAEFCALCLGERGPFAMLPYGKDDALVRVCRSCQHEHPRDGRYSFSETSRLPLPCVGHKTRWRH